MARDANENLGVLRVMHPEVAKNQKMRADFVREDYIDSTLSHEALIRVIDSGSDATGSPYLVREVVQGETVQSWLEKNGGFLPIPQALTVVEQVLRLLDLAHRNQIVHGHLAPANLYRTKDGAIKVMNFGSLPKGGAFMAPEQTPDAQQAVGVKTDIWSAGALLMHLLTGRSPYRGDRDPAISTRGVPGIRSLSDVLAGAPAPLVEMLDQALSANQEERFNRIGDFLRVFADVREGVQEMDLSEVVPRTAQINHSGNSDGVLDFDSSGYSNLTISNLKDIFAQLDQCRSVRRQYGLEHSETQTKFQRAYKAGAYALDEHDGPIFWTVTPYSIQAADQSIWEPGPPNDSICYALYAKGVRAMGFTQGLKEAEFVDWLKLMTLDPFKDLAFDDDLVTYLWDADFGETVFQLIPVDGGLSIDAWSQHKAFTKGFVSKIRRPVRSGIVEAWQGWQAARRTGAPGTRKKAQVVWAALNGVTDGPGYTAAAEDVEKAWNAGGKLALSQIALAPAERRTLTTAFESESIELDGPFAAMSAEGFVQAPNGKIREVIVDGLRNAVEDLCEESADLGLELILHLVERLPEEETGSESSLQHELLDAVLTEENARRIFEYLLELRLAERDIYFERLVRFTSMLPANMAPTVIQIIYAISETALRHVLLDFLKEHGSGHEEGMSGLFTILNETEGLALANLLTDFGSEKAKEAVGKGVASPYPLVRVQALENMDETSGTQVREELRTLLEDENETVRLTALDAINKYKIKAAGPYLVLRIRQPDFFDYSEEERKKSLETLAVLRPDRAERICVEILLDTAQVRSTSLDETRVHATRILVDVAHSKFAFDALKQTALGHERRTSDGLRTAAAEALNQITMKIRARREPKANSEGKP
jgi:serine/threonine-protein kinase